MVCNVELMNRFVWNFLFNIFGSRLTAGRWTVETRRAVKKCSCVVFPTLKMPCVSSWEVSSLSYSFFRYFCSFLLAVLGFSFCLWFSVVGFGIDVLMWYLPYLAFHCQGLIWRLGYLWVPFFGKLWVLGFSPILRDCLETEIYFRNLYVSWWPLFSLIPVSPGLWLLVSGEPLVFVPPFSLVAGD